MPFSWRKTNRPNIPPPIQKVKINKRMKYKERNKARFCSRCRCNWIVSYQLREYAHCSFEHGKLNCFPLPHTQTGKVNLYFAFAKQWGVWSFEIFLNISERNHIHSALWIYSPVKKMKNEFGRWFGLSLPDLCFRYLCVAFFHSFFLSIFVALFSPHFAICLWISFLVLDIYCSMIFSWTVLKPSSCFW